MNSSTDSPLEKFKGALSSAGKKFKHLAGNQWEAQCPAHDDNRASLGFKEADDAGTKLLVHCQAGCAPEDVVRALGLRMRDLFPQGEEDRDRRPRAHRGEPQARARQDASSRGAPLAQAPLRKARRGPGREVARYEYVDEKGELQVYVVRYEPKDFRQGTPDPSKPGGISWGLKGKSVRQVIYRLPRVRAAIERGTTIFIVEGEKDVEALEQLGVVATCNAGGAGKWRDSHTECLKGAKGVVIVPDRDEPGAAHAAAVAKVLTGVAEQVLLLQLPGDVKDAADWVAAGGTAEQLDALAADAPLAADWFAGNACTSAPITVVRVPTVGTLPTIMLSQRQLRDVEDETWRAILAANDPPNLFRRGRAVVTTVEQEGMKQVDLLTKEAAYGMLARFANWMRLNSKGKPIDASPSRDIAQQIVVRPSSALPELRDLVRVPTFIESGELLATPGYSAKARVLLDLPPTLSVPEVPALPSVDEISAAVALLLDDMLKEFPFEAQSDRAHALAALLGPMTRMLVNGATPLHSIEAPTPGSGKGLLADVISITNTGAVCASTTVPADETDMRKKITALLRRGPSLVVWDNVRDELDSAELASALTGEFWEDRILGISECAVLPNRATWLMTANNPTFSQELARRTIRIRIDPKRDQPWKRDGFRHPDLRGWLYENRGRVLHALLTIVRAWVAAGMPPGSAKPLGSFERWTRVMGGILEVAQVPGFLGNLDEMYELADAKGQEKREFVAAWWEFYGPRKLKASELLNLVTAKSLLPSEVDKTNHHGRLTQLAHVLRGMRGRRFGALAVAIEADTHTKASWYSLRRDGGAGGER